MAKKRDRKVWRLEELEAKIHREFCPDAIKLATRLAERTGLPVKQLAEMPVEDILNFKNRKPNPPPGGVDRRPKAEKWRCIERCLLIHHQVDGSTAPMPRHELVKRTGIPYATILRLFKESAFQSWTEYENKYSAEKPSQNDSDVHQILGMRIKSRRQ